LLSENQKTLPRLLDKKCYPEVIEITGAPCSGKTTFIKRVYPNEDILLGGMPLSYGYVKRLLCSIFVSLYALLSKTISFKQTCWVLIKAANYDENLFSRINALRNSMAKFGYFIFKPKNNSILVDEGISHIPFILGLKREDVDHFIMLFWHQLGKIRIIFIEASTNEKLKARIVTRGHKRVRAVKDAEDFVKKNIMIANYYKRALIDAGFDVSII